MESKEETFNNKKLDEIKEMILIETQNLSLDELSIVLYGIMKKTNTII
ncbi:hypothetical protein [Clostridium botulinum]|nr:hypothetical protein [Clostridium botulinum]MBY6915510.1 hypothetical protein [Clostridium botulinum]